MKNFGLLVLTTMLCLIGCRTARPGKVGWVYYPKAISGVDGEVTALATHDSILYVGGKFTLAGKADARNIATWDGHAWSKLGEGLAGQVERITVDGNGLIYAYSQGYYAGNQISRWDGRAWKTIADSIEGKLTNMFIDSGNGLLISGQYSRNGYKVMESAERWNGSAWRRLEAPGPLLADARGIVFAYDSRSEDGVKFLQTFRLESEDFIEFGGRLPLKGVTKDGLRAVFDGFQRLLVANHYIDAKGEPRLDLSRLDTNGEWRAIRPDSQIPDIDFVLQDKLQTSRTWIVSGACLYSIDGDSIRQTGICDIGFLLAQMSSGQFITAGGTLRIHNRLEVKIAKRSGDAWIGMDTSGIDLREPTLFPNARMHELFQRIPDKGRPDPLSERNLQDIVPDDRGGLYLGGSFTFDKSGAFFRNIVHWKNGSFSPLGGGLYCPGGPMRFALAPDGSLYAANSSLTAAGSESTTSLHRWDGRAWHFVRTTPRVIDMVFDKHGNLYALVYQYRGYQGPLCRIPVESGDEPEWIGRSIEGANHLEADDSLVHVYGDFLRAGDSLSPGHAAWRIPQSRGRKPRKASPASTHSATERIRVIQEGADEISLQDSTWVEQTARFSLCNSTGVSFDTAYLEMPRIDGLRLQSYSQGQSYDIPASEYSISPHAGGFTVKVRIRDSVTSRGNLPLLVSLRRQGLLSKTPPDGYLFQDTLHPLVANLYEDGREESKSFYVKVGSGFPIQGKRHLRDTVVRAAVFPPPFIWKLRPDPVQLPDPFFRNPEHKNKWYSHLLDCRSSDEENKLEDFPLPAGLTLETVYGDLWRNPIAPSDSEVEYSCGVSAKPWVTGKDTAFLVFLGTETHFEHAQRGFSENRMLRIGLYRRNPEGRPQLAAAAEPREYEYHEHVSNDEFELTSYRLTETESAFGLTLDRRYMYSHMGSGYSSTKTLYRVEGEVLKPILSTVMYSHSTTAGDEDEDGFRPEVEASGGSATLTVLKRKTQGIHDLKKSREDGKSCVFKWDGEGYFTNGKDPVTDVNAD